MSTIDVPIILAQGRQSCEIEYGMLDGTCRLKVAILGYKFDKMTRKY